MILRGFLGLLVAVLLPVVVAYALFPSLAGWLAARQAEALGLERLQVDAGRPGPDGLQVRSVTARGEAFSLALEDVRLHWSWRSLSAGRMLGVEVGAASLSVLTGMRETVPAQAAAPGTGAAQRNLFAVLPFDRGRVAVLEVAVPALDARATGTLDYEADVVSFTLESRLPVSSEDFLLAGRLAGTGEVEISAARTGEPERPFLHVRSALPETRLEMEVDARLDGFMLDLAAALAGLPAGSGLVTGRWRLTHPWPADGGIRWASIAGGGPFAVDWTSADGRLVLTDVAGQAVVDTGIIDTPLTGRVAARLDDVRMSLAPERLRLTPSPLALDTEGQIHLETPDLTLEGHAEAALAEAGSARYRITGDLEGWLDALDRRFPFLARTAAELAGSGLTGTVHLSSGPLEEVPVAVRYDARTTRVDLQARHRLSFGQPLLAALLPGWNETYDLDAGTLELGLALVSDPSGISGDAVAGLSGIAAHVGAIAIRGLAGAVNLRLGPQGLRLAPSTLRSTLTDFGVPLRDVEVQLHGTPAALQVGPSRADVLGGQANAPAFLYRLDDGSAAVPVTLTGLDLAEVLALEGDHMTGTGILDGTLPLTLDEGRVRVEAGKLTARPPGGVIRLAPSITGALTRPGLELALTALSDFRYQVLEATVSYASSGDLDLGVRLEGRNPEVERGRPIHFNLNVSENIPVLLQSLRLKDEFAERIERRVRR